MSDFDRPDRPLYYVLDDAGQPVPEPDALAWGRWFEQASKDVAAGRRVGRTDVGDVYVSTVFLGIDHQYLSGPPLLFESMVFGGEYDEWQWRYHTREEAQRGHDRIVAALREGRQPDMSEVTP